MEWKPWFVHGDGTPRAMYMTVQDKTELVLAETYDGCELTVRLEAGNVAYDKKFVRDGKERNADINDTAVQAWAEAKAVTYLDELAALAKATSNAIKAK